MVHVGTSKVPSRSGVIWARLLELIDLARHPSCRSVHASSGDVAAPSRNGVTELIEVRAKFLPGKPALAHVGDLILDAWLVLRTAYARGVDEESSPLRVFKEGAIEHGLRRVRVHDRRRHVVGHDTLDDASEEAPRRFESLDEDRASLHNVGHTNMYRLIESVTTNTQSFRRVPSASAT